MKKWIQQLSLFILLFSIGQFSFGQKTAVIKGKVTDGKLPVEFVDVILKNTSDSVKVANYAVTDVSGNFDLENVTSGEYLLQFKLIGFKTIIQKVKIGDTPVSIGTVVLQNDTNLLNDVVVKSQKKQFIKTV
jgi:hypothetical protein